MTAFAASALGAIVGLTLTAIGGVMWTAAPATVSSVIVQPQRTRVAPVVSFTW